MKAIVVSERDPHLKIKVADVADPAAGPDDLLVQVEAAGLNWADLRVGHVTFGGQAANAHVIPGLEMAGVVVAVGANVSGFRVGDRVMGMANESLAELVRIDHRRAMKVPGGVSWEIAGASSVSMFTAHDALFTNGELKAGQSVFIHAATSGVGFAATQMASMIGAHPVFGSGSSEAKLDIARNFGLEVAVNYREQDFLEIVSRETDGQGVDLIIDTVGAGVLERNMKAVRIGGRIIGVGRFGGKMDEIDLDLLALRRISLIGVTFRTRSIEEHRLVVERFANQFLRDFEAGRLTMPIAQVYRFEEAQEAFEVLASRDHIGKLVLRPNA